MDLLLKDLAIPQLILEILLLILLVAVLWRTKGGTGDGSYDASESFDSPAERAIGPDKQEIAKLEAALDRFLKESAKISKSFEANLADKKELSTSLIIKLDRRLADYRALLAQTDAAVKEAEKRLAQIVQGGKTPAAPEAGNPAAPETRALVLRLAQKGLSVEEIAERAKLLRGEVELIINLEKEFSL